VTPLVIIVVVVVVVVVVIVAVVSVVTFGCCYRLFIFYDVNKRRRDPEASSVRSR